MRRSFLALIAGLVLIPITGVTQTYPDRPVRIVIPFAAGGSLDVVARAVGQPFQAESGQPLVLDNRGGAGGTIAAEHVARSRPDGYTLILASAGQIGIAKALYPNLTYNVETDLVPITHLVNSPFTLFVAANFPAKTLTEVIAQGRANPGRIPFGSPGNGSIGHLALEMFAQATGTTWLHVPYRGAAQVMNDMLAGTVRLTFTVPASAKPHVDSGRMRVIAVTGSVRSGVMPDVPTFAELGYPSVDAPLWLGVMAPKDTPQPVIDRLNALFLAAMQDSTVRSTMANVGADIVAMGPADFQAMLRGDTERWGETVRKGNITLN